MCAGDAHTRTFQRTHGELPPQLVTFLQGEARWDARLCAWLLWIRSNHGDAQLGQQDLWALYIRSLPAPAEQHLLCNYTPVEQLMLQLPWCAFYSNRLHVAQI